MYKIGDEITVAATNATKIITKLDPKCSSGQIYYADGWLRASELVGYKDNTEWELVPGGYLVLAEDYMEFHAWEPRWNHVSKLPAHIKAGWLAHYRKGSIEEIVE